MFIQETGAWPDAKVKIVTHVYRMIFNGIYIHMYVAIAQHHTCSHPVGYNKHTAGQLAGYCIIIINYF